MSAWRRQVRGLVLALGVVGCTSQGQPKRDVTTSPYGCKYSAGLMGRVCVEPATPEESCGNGVIDEGEACDGVDLGGASCASVTNKMFPGGDLVCSPQCNYDTTNCTPPPANRGDRMCGTTLCEAVHYPRPTDNWVACCPEGADVGTCGIDVSYLPNEVRIDVSPVCQARSQPGAPSRQCPSRTLAGFVGGLLTGGGPVQTTLDGCCRPEGVCGSMMDVITFSQLSAFNVGAGCVAATAFGDDAAAAVPCTPGGERDASPDVPTDSAS